MSGRIGLGMRLERPEFIRRALIAMRAADVFNPHHMQDLAGIRWVVESGQDLSPGQYGTLCMLVRTYSRQLADPAVVDHARDQP